MIDIFYKPWSPGVSQLTAEEMAGLAGLIQAGFLPGLQGAASLAATTAGGSVVTLTDFVAGDFIFTGGALVTAFDALTLDFATAGPAGGALPSGTYKLYLRVEPNGSSSDAAFVASLAASNESNSYDVDDASHLDAVYTGTIDETVYLVLRENALWNGAAVSWVSPTDNRGGQWGLIDAATMLRGDLSEITIDRDVQINGALSVDEFTADELTVDALTLAAFGSSEIGQFHNLLIGENVSVELGTGFEMVAPAGDALLDLGDGSQLTLGWASILQMLNGSTAWIETGAALEIDGIVSLDAAAYFETDAPLRVHAAAPATPVRDGIYADGLLRAVAVVTGGAAPVISSGFNAATVTKTGTGTFDITFSRAFTSATYAAVAVPLGTSADRARVRARTTGQCTVNVFDAGGLADDSFVLLVFGGVQA